MTAALNVVWSRQKLGPSRQSRDRNQTVRQRFVPSLGVSLSLGSCYFYTFISLLDLTRNSNSFSSQGSNLNEMVHPSSILWLVFPLLCVIIQLADGNPGSYPQPKPHYSSQGGSQPYLPAPTGKRPSCAGPTDTFCTKVDYYPT